PQTSKSAVSQVFQPARCDTLHPACRLGSRRHSRLGSLRYKADRSIWPDIVCGILHPVGTDGVDIEGTGVPFAGSPIPKLAPPRIEWHFVEHLAPGKRMRFALRASHQRAEALLARGQVSGINAIGKQARLETVHVRDGGAIRRTITPSHQIHPL